MQQLLIRAALLCLFTGPALADASISTLQSATVPLPANSCIPTSQGPGTDAVICSGYAAAFGLPTATLAITDTQVSPDPTGISGTSPLMQGLAAPITPTATGTVYMVVVGSMSNTIAADGATVQIKYGTGAAPSNQGLSHWSSCGKVQQSSSNPTASIIPFTAHCLATGLTLNTAYWVDVTLNAITAGVASIKNVEVVLEER